MRYMLDTNICIYAIKHKPEKVFQKLQEVDPADVCISSITYAELVHGVEKSAAIDKNRLALSLLLAIFLALSSRISRKNGKTLRKPGAPDHPSGQTPPRGSALRRPACLHTDSDLCLLPEDPAVPVLSALYETYCLTADRKFFVGRKDNDLYL